MKSLAELVLLLATIVGIGALLWMAFHFVSVEITGEPGTGASDPGFRGGLRVFAGAAAVFVLTAFLRRRIP
ncbi:hypothetical protein [Pseudogemmobacter humi]|uniref:Uncharacterized protein n=1 Tax=Pseudogemmobacter humi TaxID=2483812 RepID=A0A3P5X667_9RHOB|nr:hypothetical protein [Pseudogemmobacter humi]VDC30028.1 hypothetical protein XINFAN_02397 [Pseudogemmobacter humi]